MEDGKLNLVYEVAKDATKDLVDRAVIRPMTNPTARLLESRVGQWVRSKWNRLAPWVQRVMLWCGRWLMRWLRRVILAAVPSALLAVA